MFCGLVPYPQIRVDIYVKLSYYFLSLETVTKQMKIGDFLEHDNGINLPGGLCLQWHILLYIYRSSIDAAALTFIVIHCVAMSGVIMHTHTHNETYMKVYLNTIKYIRG